MYKTFAATLAKHLESKYFIGFITTLILVNAVTLGMETNASMMASFGDQIYVIDKIILSIFTAEIMLKLIAYRHRFFTSGWNLFDFSIVAIAWIPAGGALSVLRALRILRVLRLISLVPQMRRVIAAIGHSIPGMISVIGVLGLIFYVSAVLATKLFGGHSDPNMQEWFGSIGASTYTLFQIMTLESWSMGVVRPTMEIFPWSWMFFLPFIIVTSFAVLNFFIGIIVDSMQIAQKLDAEANGNDADLPMTKKEFRDLMERFDAFEQKIQGQIKPTQTLNATPPTPAKEQNRSLKDNAVTHKNSA